MEAKGKAGEEDLSMEEILQSIRKIIAEDGDDAAPKPPQGASADAGSDVLELTEIVEEAPPAAAAPAAPPAPPKAEAPPVDVLSKIDEVVMPDAPKPAAPVAVAPAPAAVADSAVMSNGQAYIDSLLSSESASAASAAFKKIQPVEMPIVTTPSAPFRSGTSVEELVMEALRPMLKSWLDSNLPSIVERIVEREIKKLSN